MSYIYMSYYIYYYLSVDGRDHLVRTRETQLLLLLLHAITFDLLPSKVIRSIILGRIQNRFSSFRKLSFPCINSCTSLAEKNTLEKNMRFFWVLSSKPQQQQRVAVRWAGPPLFNKYFLRANETTLRPSQLFSILEKINFSSAMRDYNFAHALHTMPKKPCMALNRAHNITLHSRS